MFLFYLGIFGLSLLLSSLLTLAIIKLAKVFGIVDRPDQEKKLHPAATPLLGGAAIFIAFWLVVYFVQDKLLVGNLNLYHWLGVFVGSSLIMFGGILDDKYDLKPSRQIIFPSLAIAAVLWGGVEIAKITNPFGGFVFLEASKIISGSIIAFWLLGMMYTTKLLDGLDGLVSGVTAIGAFIIFLFTLTTRYYQPDIALAALILTGAIFGFLIFNWHPAKIFLGEGGSLFLGFILGVLAIISGGKIAIALLVMGLPMMDVAWTIVRRLSKGKNPFKSADRQHLHHRLLDLGLGVKKTVLIFYAFSLFFGISALFLQSKGKALALLALVVIMLSIVISFNYIDRKKI